MVQIYLLPPSVSVDDTVRRHLPDFTFIFIYVMHLYLTRLFWSQFMVYSLEAEIRAKALDIGTELN